MNSPPTQMIGYDLSTIEWPTLLFDGFRYTLNVATESGRVCDALEAIAAWHQWLLVDQPDPNRRASIQHRGSCKTSSIEKGGHCECSHSTGSI
jgi:hypothetical protein